MYTGRFKFEDYFLMRIQTTITGWSVMIEP